MITGLTSEEVLEQRNKDGFNVKVKSTNLLFQTVFSVVKEPMFILLLVACAIYFILKEYTEALSMFAALVFVAGIDVFQNFRSQRAVIALNKMTQQKAQVLREGKVITIPSEQIVTKDILVCEEGGVISADAEIVSSNDFSVNEAILTGESVAVEKTAGQQVMQGTFVVRGYAYARVTAIGENTQLSGISLMVKDKKAPKSPFYIKIKHFVRAMVVFGSVAFLFVWGYHYWESGSLIHGLLHGLTMAMSILPEEIPVAFSTFMALGAYRLLKAGVIARNPQAVETLGSATVICVDKTGTITENLMRLAYTFDFTTAEEVDFEKGGKPLEVLEYAMWSSEIDPFDTMEKSIHEKYAEHYPLDQRPEYKMVKEYPLGGIPPVMTHIFESNKSQRKIACKGALEGILKLTHLEEKQQEEVMEKARKLAEKGFRVLGVAKGSWTNEAWPQKQEDFDFSFLGIISFYDPPVKGIKNVISDFQKAGIKVKMITGDYAATALAIARQVGIKVEKVLIGKDIDAFNEEELSRQVSETAVFARVSPQTKLKIVDALKRNGEVVAMTGDGVNDAPALKSAHIGVAMGKRGTEVARESAGLVLSDDNLSSMVNAIFLGRRINENLRKAIRYIMSIHIPIILMVIMPVFLGWLPIGLFMPVHIIFLELIMGPTCSIIYENEPTPRDELWQLPNKKQSLLSGAETLLTILQGAMITLGCIGAGYYASHLGLEENHIRSYIFSVLVLSNVLLTLVSRSFVQTIFKTIQWKNRLIPVIIFISLALWLTTIYVPFLRDIFALAYLQGRELLLIGGIAFCSVFWVEGVKFFKLKSKQIAGTETEQPV